MKSGLITLIRIAFLLGRTLPAASGRWAYRLFSKPGPPRRLTPRAARVLARAERLSLAHQGRRLVGYRWHPAAARPDSPVVLLAHGWSSRAARFTRWVEPLTAAGFEVVAFDGPAHGLSAGRQVSMLDYIGTLSAIADHIGVPYAIVGHSFGAAASVFAASGSALTGIPEVPVERLVLIASPDAADQVFDRFGAFFGLDGRQLGAMKQAAVDAYRLAIGIECWSAAEILSSRPIRTLVIHDRDDGEVPLADGRSIARAPEAEAMITEGLGHHRIVGDAAVIARGVDFLNEGRLRQAPAAAGSRERSIA